MSRSARSAVLIGIVLAVVSLLLIDHGARVGAQVVHLGTMGLAVGAVLGLVPDRAPAWRAGAFASGVAAAWLGFVVRAGWLPDIPLGRALSTAIAFAVVTAAVALSVGRFPLWAGLLGLAAFFGGYESTFAANPAGFVTDSITAVTTIGLTVGLGFFAVTLVDGFIRPRATEQQQPPPPLAPARRHPITAALPVQRDADAFDDDLVAAIAGKDAR